MLVHLTIYDYLNLKFPMQQQGMVRNETQGLISVHTAFALGFYKLNYIITKTNTRSSLYLPLLLLLTFFWFVLLL